MNAMENLNNNQTTVNLFESDDKYLELLQFCFDEESNGKTEATKNNSCTRVLKRSVPAKLVKVGQSQPKLVESSSSLLGPKNIKSTNSPIIDESYVSKIKRLGDQVVNFYLQKRYKTFVWTALESGAGTSTIVNHLAGQYAKSGLKVLTVDVNFDNPAHHLLCNQENEIEATESLNHGFVHLIKNRGIKNAFEELKNKFDLILIDAPSLEEKYLSTLVFASIADGCVLVAKSENTRIDKAQAMINQLQSNGANILGLVLNRKKSYLPKFFIKRF